MKKFFSLLSFVTIAFCIQAQTAHSLHIAHTPIYVSSICDSMPVIITQNDDSTLVYTSECTEKDLGYGIIFMNFKDEMIDPATKDAWLTEYLDYLKESLEIEKTSDYKTGFILPSNPNTKGISEIWVDREGDSWMLKAWMSNTYIACLFIYGEKLPAQEMADQYLNSLQFKSDQ